MSEKRIDVRKLPISKVVDLFLAGKIPKSDMEDLDKSSLFRVSSKRLERILNAQKKNPKTFPKNLKIKSEDIIHEYGRTLSAGELMNLASQGYVSELDVLKALKKDRPLMIMASMEKESSEKTGDGKGKNPPSDLVIQNGGVDSSSKKEKGVGELRENEPMPITTQLSTTELDSIKPKDGDVEPVEFSNVEFEEDEKPKEMEFSRTDILTRDDVKKFLSTDRLLQMFFAKKMTKEFAEAYSTVFKDDVEYNKSQSQKLIKKLKGIFDKNLQALYIVVLRLHFKGMILVDDVKDLIKAEYFREKIYQPSEDYNVLDDKGKVIYSYKRTKSDVPEIEPEVGIEVDIGAEQDEEELIDVYSVEDYPILEPISKDEVIDFFNDSNIGIDTLNLFFTLQELMELYKNNRVSVYVFILISREKRKDEIIKAYNEGYINLSGIMELFFYYNAITAEELKSIMKEIPKNIAIVNFITMSTELGKIKELYECYLIDYNVLIELKEQEYISQEQFEQISGFINKDAFYKRIQSQVFYTNTPQTVMPTNQEVLDSALNVEEEKDKDKSESDDDFMDRLDALIGDNADSSQDGINAESNLDRTDDFLEHIVEITEGERILLTRVLGVSEEEIDNISIIRSIDNGKPTSLDGYQIISNASNGLVILGKFDFSSPIYVMTYEEAAYLLRSRDEKDEQCIYDDLMYPEVLAKNGQVRVVEHNETMGKNIVSAMCELSETAKERYSEDAQYVKEVQEMVKMLDEKYFEMMREFYNI